MNSRTWTELLGPMRPGEDFVDGNRWVREDPRTGRVKVLWAFQTEQQAREAFHWWWWGR